MKKFLKYRIELNNVSEDEFSNMFYAQGEWEGIRSEADRFGICSIGISQSDSILFEGKILKTTIRECKGVFGDLKVWIKQHYKCKNITNLIVITGDQLF